MAGCTVVVIGSALSKITGTLTELRRGAALRLSASEPLLGVFPSDFHRFSCLLPRLRRAEDHQLRRLETAAGGAAVPACAEGVDGAHVAHHALRGLQTGAAELRGLGSQPAVALLAHRAPCEPARGDAAAPPAATWHVKTKLLSLQLRFYFTHEVYPEAKGAQKEWKGRPV